MSKFEEFTDETDAVSDPSAKKGGRVRAAIFGKRAHSRSEDDVAAAPSSSKRCSREPIWRQAVVRSMKRPGRHQQQQASWDSVRTVELHEEEQLHQAQQRAARAHGFCIRWWWAMQGSVLAVGVGVLCFASYAVIEIGIRALSSVRFGFCVDEPFNPEEHCSADSWISWGDGPVGFTASVGLGTLMAALSAWLVSRFAPAASGSGIPEIKTILNGFVVVDVLSFRTLIVKIPCLILAVASGMALGHEGPMVHVGVCWAQFLIRFCPQFQNEGKRRELYSAAVAAGVSSAFGTPVGGVLFSLEEVSSHFPSRTLLRSFLASIAATLALSVANLTGTKHLTLFDVKYTTTFHPSEYVLFALLGLAGGLVGSIFNAINIKWNTIRMSPSYKRRMPPVREVIVISFLTLVTSWPLALTKPLNPNAIHALFDTCAGETGETMRSRLQYEIGLCTWGGQYKGWDGNILTELGGAAVIRFFQMALTIGTVCPAGLFVPSLFIGASLGRCLGLAIKAINSGNQLFPNSVDPGVYSMVGAAAVLGGVSRMTISLVVIMLELTNGLDYVVPFMLSVFMARAVGDALNEGIYDLYIVLKGYPFLHEELDITFTERCCDVMETGLTKLDVGLQPRVTDLRIMLRAFAFRGFPIVEGTRFIGYINRKRLDTLLNQIEAKRGELAMVELDELMTFADSTIMRMAPEAPLSQAHQVFKQLGCQHIFVVGSQQHGEEDVLLGLLSKKSFLQFLREGKVGHMPDQAYDVSTFPSPSNGNFRFQFSKASCTSTANHIYATELFSVMDDAAKAAEAMHNTDQADGAESTSNTEGGDAMC